MFQSPCLHNCYFCNLRSKVEYIGQDVTSHYRNGESLITQYRRKSYVEHKKLNHVIEPSNYRFEDRNAIVMYGKLLENGMRPDVSILVAALRECSSLRDLYTGTKIHAAVINSGDHTCGVVANTLVHMYTKCGCRLHAHLIFNRIPEHDLVSWNAVIFGYSEDRDCKLAMQLCFRMQEEGFIPNSITYIAVLKACANCAAIEESSQSTGKFVNVEYLENAIAVRSQIVKSVHKLNIFVGNSLIDTYFKCGSIAHARHVFDNMPCHDLVSWTAMIFGYAGGGQSELSLQLFSCMQDEGIKADAQTYVAALKACALCAAKEEGTQVDGICMKIGCLEKTLAIHSQLAKHSLQSDIFVASTLVDIYAKCGSMLRARRVFDSLEHCNVVLWNALIFGYADSGESNIALRSLMCMQEEGFMPYPQTYVAVLKACMTRAASEEYIQVDGKRLKMESLQKAIAIHSQVAKSGQELDLFVASSLLDMYAKCGSMGHARMVFDRMPFQDVVSWNAIMFGYAETGECNLVLQLFAQMQDQGFVPDARTYLATLKACGDLGALETGKKIHVQICSDGLQNDIILASCLVGFYGKCGSLVDAREVFDGMLTRDLVTWNAMLAGYASQGDTGNLFDLFDRMQNECCDADGVTFLSVLTACSHAGLVHKGKEYFQAMCLRHMITPNIKHYTCMVDLLVRANYLDDGIVVTKKMPFIANMSVWRTVLGACRKWKNIVAGRISFESILELDEMDASAYVLVSSIYADFEM